MIRVSNLRKESLPESKECRIICDIDCSFAHSKQLWFSVPEEFGDWLTDDVYDAFMVAMLYPAMYYNESIEIDGCVSEKLFYNLTQYVQSVVKAYRPEMFLIDIQVKGFENAVTTQRKVGTAFSAGIDAFTTFYDHYEVEKNPNYKISSLFFFNLGSHGSGEDARKKFLTRYNYLKPFADRFSMPFVPLDSNLFSLYLSYWELDAGVFCRATGALVFEKVLSKYLIGSDMAYVENMDSQLDKVTFGLAAFSEYYLHPMLSTETLEIITDGAQYTRVQKTERIIDYAPAKDYLNVCVSPIPSAKNCSRCGKCQRTLFTLDALGKLQEYEKVFDLDEWKKDRYRYKCRLIKAYKKDIYAKDNVDLAKSRGEKFPSKIWAYLVIDILGVRDLVKRHLFAK